MNIRIIKKVTERGVNVRIKRRRGASIKAKRKKGASIRTII